MVDNENQWDEIEYSDDNTQEYYDYDNSQDYDTSQDFNTDNENSEYSEEDYENSYEDTDEDDYYDDREESSSSKKSNMLPILILALLLLGVGGFFAVSKLSGGNNADKNIADNTTVEQEDSMFESSNEDDSFFNQNDETSSDMMSVDFNDSGDAQVKSSDDNDDTVATVKSSNEDSDLFSNADDFSQNGNSENNDIIISYDKTTTRINPFKPPFQEKQNSMSKYALVQNTEFEIIEPPTESVPDTNLERLLKTQISGILYDDVSPSAIVNLNGVDTFVKAGDTIHGFTIQSITRNKVQITYRNNTYVAAVGELFTPGTLDKPTVANLEKKFAGRYK